MGITIWTGTSGTGKTSQMFNEIEALTKDSPLGSNIYIITPTQNTLSYEQLIATAERRAGWGQYEDERIQFYTFNVACLQ